MYSARLFVLPLILLLSACGFQLRGLGSHELAFSQLQLTGEDSHSALNRAVQQRLQAQGIELSPAAEFSLHLEREQQFKRKISGSPGSHSAEYQLGNSLAYSIRSGNLPPLVSGQVQVQRNLLTNQNQTSDEEERLLRNEMRDELVMQLMLRLHALQPEQLQLRKEQELQRMEAERAAARELELRQQLQTPAAP